MPHQRAESGPLEALLAELEFNKHAVSGDRGSSFPPLENTQFRRAIALNALASLSTEAEGAVFLAYRAVGTLNHYLEAMMTMREAEMDYAGVRRKRDDVRENLQRTLLPDAVHHLGLSLGRSA